MQECTGRELAKRISGVFDPLDRHPFESVMQGMRKVQLHRGLAGRAPCVFWLFYPKTVGFPHGWSLQAAIAMPKHVLEALERLVLCFIMQMLLPCFIGPAELSEN